MWLVFLLLGACGGGGHSPTAPAGFTTFTTVLLNQDLAATIEDAKVVLDGVVVAIEMCAGRPDAGLLMLVPVIERAGEPVVVTVGGPVETLRTMAELVL